MSFDTYAVLRAETSGGGTPPPNIVILLFRLASLTISTTRLSGQKYLIEQTILHNLSKINSCKENFYKFTKILMKNLCF
jgi:hypothetical protein